METITRTGVHKLAGVDSLGLCTNATPRHGPFWIGANRPLQRRLTGWEFSYPLPVIRGAGEFQRVVQLCVADPTVRSTIV